MAIRFASLSSYNKCKTAARRLQPSSRLRRSERACPQRLTLLMMTLGMFSRTQPQSVGCLTCRCWRQSRGARSRVNGDAYAQLAHHVRSALPTGDLRKAVEYCTQAACALRVRNLVRSGPYIRTLGQRLDSQRHCPERGGRTAVAHVYERYALGFRLRDVRFLGGRAIKRAGFSTELAPGSGSGLLFRLILRVEES